MVASPDERQLYQIAEAQAGFFSARQAHACGFSSPLLAHHVKRGKFLRVRRGVYRLSAFPEMPFADLFVAWLASGGRGVVSHESALALYGLSDWLPSEIHLTVPRTASRRLPGVRLHTARLRPDEITYRQGLPVTTLPRTLADLIRGGWPTETITQAVRQALVQGLVSEETLRTYARQRGGRVEQWLTRAMEVERPL